MILSRNPRHARGFSLIEVLIAVVVLSFGLLALAALQGRLARASADSKAQSVALALAEERFEGFRAFVNRGAYQQIGQAAHLQPQTLAPAGAAATFTRTARISRFVFDDASQSFVGSTDLTATPVRREYKLVEVTVAWQNAEAQTQQVKLANILSSASPEDSALTLRAPVGTSGGPRVRIFKPTGTGIIPIAIGNNQSSASSNPQPELSRSGTTTLTQFNVQTYLGQNATPLLQRRVDNAVINCTCAFDGVSSATKPAYEPTYWDGARYRSPREVLGRVIGRSADNFRQSEGFQESLCTTCCRDHHERPGTVEVDGKRIVKYDFRRPAGDIAANGNHNHYPPSANFASSPLPSPVTSGTYGEVCRLVRVDGIFRVATDLRLENSTQLRLSPYSASQASDNQTFPFEPDSVLTYAEFVKKYIDYSWNGLAGVWGGSKLEANKDRAVPDLLLNCSSTPCVNSALATDTTVPAGSALSIAKMLDVDKQSRLTIAQTTKFDLAQRGLYIDYISDEAREALLCIGSTESRCQLLKDKSVLEIVPFTAINLTNLADWSSGAPAIATVRNDGISNAGYVRGQVTGNGAPPSGTPWANILANVTRGNAGAVDREAIDPDDAQLLSSDVDEFISNGSPPPRFTVRIIDSTGNNSGFDKKALILGVTDPVVSPPDCRRQTGANRDLHACTGSATAATLKMRFSNYNVPDCPSGTGGVKWNYDASSQKCRSTNGLSQDPTFTDFKLCRFEANSLPTGVIHLTPDVVTTPGWIETTVVTLSGTIANLKDPVELKAVFTLQNGSCP